MSDGVAQKIAREVIEQLRLRPDPFPAVCVTPGPLGPLRYKIMEVWSALPMPRLFIGWQTFGSCGHHLI